MPALPEPFGNPVLTGFHELFPETGVDWWPQTPGWYALSALLLVWLGYKSWRSGKRWYRNRYRREALRELRAIGQLSVAQQPAAINDLLKRVAIVAASRQEVAQLHGDTWRQWLCERAAAGILSPTTLTALTRQLYQSPTSSAAPTLLADSAAWIRQHRDDHE